MEVGGRFHELVLRRRNRLVRRILRFLLLLVVSWTVMTFTHEMGHILAGWTCGGTLQAADLVPWHLPYSFFQPDPKPLVTLWSGPILGVLVPLGLAVLIRRDWMWFIADFCLLANGTYLATSWVSGDRNLDTPKLLAHGAHPATILFYCCLTIGLGYVRFRRSCIHTLAAGKHSTATVVCDNETKRDDNADEATDDGKSRRPSD